jgi:hypothetical protein
MAYFVCVVLYINVTTLNSHCKLQSHPGIIDRDYNHLQIIFIADHDAFLMLPQIYTVQR